MGIDLSILFTRPYWLDEWHAVLVAERATPAGVLSDLRHGADFAPPLLHLVLWLLRVLSGGTLEPWLARSFTVACTVGAVAFTYLILRRRFDRAPSWVGALAIATQGIVVAYAFEARFYAPWLFFAAAFAWALSIDAARPVSRRRDLAAAIAAVGLCTVHWFGVVTLGLMCAGAALAFGRDWRAAARRIVPAAAGVAALMVCLPLMLAQRGTITEKSWIAELSWPQLRDLLVTFWGALPPVAALAVIGIALALSRTKARSETAVRAAIADPSILALLAPAAMPLVLTVISVLQPMMLPRYAVASVLAWAPLVALAAQLVPRAVRVGAVALAAVGVLLAVGGQLGVQRHVVRATAIDRLLLREACRAGAVTFTTRVQMYYHTDVLRRDCPRATYLVLPRETLARLFVGPNETTQPFYRNENEFAHLHERLYGFPVTATPAQLDSLPHFVVMAEPSSLPRDAAGNEFFTRIVFPRYRATPLNGGGALYERVR